MHDLTDLDVDELFMRIAWRSELRPNGCLLVQWRESEYPSIRIAGERITLHRLVYALVHGPIPDELIVDHHCHNLDLSCKGGNNCPHRRCIRPEHLRAVPQLDNILDGALCRNSKPKRVASARLRERPRLTVEWISTVDLAIALGRVPVGGDPNRAAVLLGKELSMRRRELRSERLPRPIDPKRPRGYRVDDLERHVPDVLGAVEGARAACRG